MVAQTAYSSSPNHFEKILSRVAKFQKDGKYTDIELTIPSESGDGFKYKCFRCILAAHSAYFRSMFTTGVTMGATNEIEIKGIHNHGFKMIFDYMLTNKLVYESSKAVVLLQSADFLQVDKASESLMRHVLRYDLTTNQNLEMAELASASLWRDLEEKCVSQISKNCNSYLQPPLSDSLLKLSYAPLLNVFSHESNESKEEDILESIFKWLKFNHSKLKSNEIENILNCVRYAYIDDKAKFNEIVSNCGDLVNISEVQNWINTAKSFLTSDNAVVPENMKPREGSYNYLLMLCKQTGHIYTYDLHKKVITEIGDSTDEVLKQFHKVLEELEMKRLFISMELVNGCLAGVNTFPKDEVKLPAFMRYENQTWHKQYRTQLALKSFIQLEYRIANIGGYDPYRGIDLCGGAMYGEGPWSLFKEMNNKRSEHALVYQAGIVYSIGGQNSDKGVLNSVELFQLDPRGEEWITTSNMLYPRQGHKAVILMDKILVVGGYNEKCNVCSNNVKNLVKVNEWYDLNSQKWSEVPSIGDKYHTHGLVACNAKAYAICSKDEDSKTIEVHSFCPKEMKWTKEQSLSTGEAEKICYATRFSAYDVSLI